MRERNLSANASLGVEVSGTARLPQAAEKIVKRRWTRNRARLPAVPPSCLKDLRHGSKPCPVTNPTPREFFRNLFQSCQHPLYRTYGTARKRCPYKTRPPTFFCSLLGFLFRL